jgi:hypothetical protein
MLSGLFGLKKSMIVPIEDSKNVSSDKIGEKGSAVSRILKCGLPVPRGFILTTDVKEEYNGTSLSDVAKKEITMAVHNIALETDRLFYAFDGKSFEYKSFDNTKFPLLLSVRQSPVQGHPSLPTILNLGMNGKVMEQMKKITGRNLFVLDTYR